MLGTWFYEHPYCTHSGILLFLLILTNVLIVKLLWIKASAGVNFLRPGTNPQV